MGTYKRQPLKTQNQLGFGLIEVLIATAILAIIAVGFSSLTLNGLKGQNAVEATADRNNLSTLISLVIQNNGCTVNVAGPPVLSFDSTPATLSSQIVNFNGNTFIYPNGTSVITKNGTWGNGLNVSKLQLNLVAEMTAGSSYIANIHVEVTKSNGMITGGNLFTVDVPISLQTQYTPAPPGPMVNIKSCGVLNAGLLSCPAGYTLVGTPSTLEAYCISSAQAIGTYTWVAASQNCYANAGYTNTAHLCSVEEWQTACVSGVPGMGFTGIGDWVSGFTYNGANQINAIGLGQNNFGCSNYPSPTGGFLADYPAGPILYSYRCCYK